MCHISDISSGGKERDNPYHWVTGAPPGVILFRRMRSGLRELILHRESVQIAYISMEQTLFKPWALEYAVAHPDKIRAAHMMRRDWNARAGVVLPDACALPSRLRGTDEGRSDCEIAQTMAGIHSDSRAPLMVAQPRLRSRSRSRSRSVERYASGVGTEIPPPAALLEGSGFSRFAAKPKKEDDKLHKRWEQSVDVRTFKGSASSIDGEPDRRSFVPSSLRFLSKEYEEMASGAAAPSVASGSSLSAALSVTQEYHVVYRAESIALHERLKEVEETKPDSETKVVEEKKPAKETKVEEWPCDGPGCGTMLRNKKEWQKYYKKYYCKSCYAANNLVPH